MHKWKIVREDRSSCFAKGKYRRYYYKGIIIEADPDTLGVMVFDNMAQALSFSAYAPVEFLLLAVEPIGKGIRPKNLCYRMREINMDDFYIYKRMNFFARRSSKLLLSVQTMPPPRGTICYPAVKVLD